MAMHQPAQDPTEVQQGPLAQSIVALAGMPDDVSLIDNQLVLITRLAATRVAAVDYASVTATREGAYTTVAASSELALAVDEAQYVDKAGPCLEPLDTAEPVGVPDIPATMRWPGFREQASALGLRASVSIPVFAGSGAPVAVLNLYSHDQAALAPVMAAIWNVFHPDSTADGGEPDSVLEPGAAELIAGLAQATTIHATIQQAVGVIMAQQGVSALDAYLTLRNRAAENKVSLTTAATALLRQIST